MEDVPDLPAWDDEAWGDPTVVGDPVLEEGNSTMADLDDLMADTDFMEALTFAAGAGAGAGAALAVTPAPAPVPVPAPVPASAPALPLQKAVLSPDGIVTALGSGLRDAMGKSGFESMWVPLYRGAVLMWRKSKANTVLTLARAGGKADPTHYDIARPGGLHALAKAMTGIEGKLGWWDTLVVQAQCVVATRAAWPALTSVQHAVWQLHMPSGTWHRRMDSPPRAVPFQEQFRMDERGHRALSVCMGPLFNGAVTVDTTPTSDVWVWLPTHARAGDVRVALQSNGFVAGPGRPLVPDATTLVLWYAVGPALVPLQGGHNVWATSWQPQVRRYRLYATTATTTR